MSMENLELIYKELVKMVLCEYNGFEKFTDTMDYIGEDNIYYSIMTGQHIDATDRDYDNYNRLMEIKDILIECAPDMGLISNIVDCEFNVVNRELLVLFCEKYECYKYWYLIIKDIFCRLYTNNNIYDYYKNEVDALEKIFDYYHKTIIPQKALSELSNTPNQEQEPQTPTNPILPPELSTPEAMKYWKKAQEAGLVDEHYQWLETKVLLACFAKEMSDRFDLGKGTNSDGSKRINWKIFENLFGVSNLRGALNDLKKTGDNPLNINLVNDIFK